MEIFNIPFPYFIQKEFLPEYSFSELKDALNFLEWEEAKSEEYLKDNSTSFSTDFVISQKASTSFNILFSEDWINKLSDLFAVSLKKCSTAVFLRMNKGFFNFVHSDENSFGELVRLILYISSPEEYVGGELLLHKNNDQKSIYSEMKFDSNTLFGFKMSNQSYHSVKEIKKGCRICLSLTYS